MGLTDNLQIAKNVTDSCQKPQDSTDTWHL